jgi:hypothetical protein
MFRCLVSVSAIVCGSGWMVIRLWRSMMVVCMPRVLKVSAQISWCIGVFGRMVCRVGWGIMVFVCRLGIERRMYGVRYGACGRVGREVQRSVECVY